MDRYTLPDTEAGHNLAKTLIAGLEYAGFEIRTEYVEMKGHKMFTVIASPTYKKEKHPLNIGERK